MVFVRITIHELQRFVNPKTTKLLMKPVVEKIKVYLTTQSSSQYLSCDNNFHNKNYNYQILI